VTLAGLLEEFESNALELLEADGLIERADSAGVVPRLIETIIRLPFGSSLMKLRRAAETQDAANVRQFEGLGLSVRDSPRISSMLDQWRDQQVGLIKSLAVGECRQLGKILAQHEGTHPRELRKIVQERFGVTRAKADLLARDQTITLSNRLSQQRMVDAGITFYIWTTAGDERVRGNPDGLWPEGLHFALEGKRFNLSSPPVISKDGRRGNPGDDYLCRCMAYPVM
jgi:SPP1 gp7 family putative phage head morphogenesis protein